MEISFVVTIGFESNGQRHDPAYLCRIPEVDLDDLRRTNARFQVNLSRLDRLIEEDDWLASETDLFGEIQLINSPRRGFMLSAITGMVAHPHYPDITTAQISYTRDLIPVEVIERAAGDCLPVITPNGEYHLDVEYIDLTWLMNHTSLEDHCERTRVVRQQALEMINASKLVSAD